MPWTITRFRKIKSELKSEAPIALNNSLIPGYDRLKRLELRLILIVLLLKLFITEMQE